MCSNQLCKNHMHPSPNKYFQSNHRPNLPSCSTILPLLSSHKEPTIHKNRKLNPSVSLHKTIRESDV